MKNACRINKDGTVSILLDRENGKTLEVLVTKEDYEKHAEPFMGRWTVYTHQRTGKIYARGYYLNEQGKREQPMLHKLIMNPGAGEITAHIDGNTLNCLPSNMLNMPIGADLQAILDQRKALEAILGDDTQDYSNKPHICNECGQVMYLEGIDGKCDAYRLKEVKPVKGVSFHKGKKKWEAKATWEGRRYNLGYFKEDQLEAANEAVAEFIILGPEEYYKKHPKGGKK